MSGIYIPNTDTPKSCGSCPYNESSCYCSKTKSRIDRDYEHIERLTGCPLVEVKGPHGRLIDADAMEWCFVNDPSCLTIFDAIKKLHGMSTIIPAEEGNTK